MYSSIATSPSGRVSADEDPLAAELAFALPALLVDCLVFEVADCKAFMLEEGMMGSVFRLAESATEAGRLDTFAVADFSLLTLILLTLKEDIARSAEESLVSFSASTSSSSP